MLTFFLAFIVFAIMVGSGVGFIAWAFCQWRTAQKYRYLIRLHQAMPPAHATSNVGPQWSVTYREKGKLRTVNVPGNTEGEAMKNFTETYKAGYGAIVSSSKL